MDNINESIKKVRTAIYGRDVRGAIADAVENISNRQSVIDAAENNRQTTYDTNELSRTQRDTNRQTTFEANERERQRIADTGEISRDGKYNTREANRQTTFDITQTTRQTTFNTREDSRQATFEAHDASRNQNEDLRNLQEGVRNKQESDRQKAETDRQKAEADRVVVETARKTAETSRATAESTRVTEWQGMKDTIIGGVRNNIVDGSVSFAKLDKTTQDDFNALKKDTQSNVISSVMAGPVTSLPDSVDGDINLEVGGNTLVNLFKKTKDVYGTTSGAAGQEYVGISITDIITPRIGKLVSLICEISTSKPCADLGVYSNGKYYAGVYTRVSTTENYKRFVFSGVPTLGSDTAPMCELAFYATYGTGIAPFVKNIMILEGDYTNKPIPDYFEGIKSVGDKQADGNYRTDIMSYDKKSTVIPFYMGAGDVSIRTNMPAGQATWYTEQGDVYTTSTLNISGYAGGAIFLSTTADLKTVEIEDTKHNANNKSDLSNFRQVTNYLSLSGCTQLTGNLSGVSGVTNYLNLYGCNQITGNLSSVSGVTNFLSLYGSAQVTGNLSSVSGVTNYLSLDGCNQVTGNLSSVSGVTNYLYLGECNQVTGILNPKPSIREIYLDRIGWSSAECDQSIINLNNTTTATGNRVLRISAGKRTSASDAAWNALKSKGWNCTEV